MKTKLLHRFMGASAALALIAGLAATAAADDWTSAPDVAKAKEQAAQGIITYGLPDDWANYGESLQQFCAHHQLPSCQHTDTDMSSNEEITRYDAEKNKPAAVFSDIGIAFGSVAEARSVVPPYLPPNAARLPDGWKAKTGGWVATFVGVPSIIVNTDVVKNVPKSWDDLLKPEYQGLIGVSDPQTSGTGGATFIAWAFAHGGDENNLEPGVEYAKKLLPNLAGPSGNDATLEKGEVPIQVRYDFLGIAAANKLKEKGVNVSVVIPDGSIYAPGAIMVNKYNTAQMDLAKLYLDWVLSDEGQLLFAKFGARPVRYVLGNLKLPGDAKGNWLPDSAYANIKTVKDWSKVDPATIAEVWKTKVLAQQ
ncbi:MAG TPA: extracellular solute-binding protein [Dongiaceae bacterium]|nr:extracellular solute-binding protein [Dongiaceae bacterium]